MPIAITSDKEIKTVENVNRGEEQVELSTGRLTATSWTVRFFGRPLGNPPEAARNERVSVEYGPWRPECRGEKLNGWQEEIVPRKWRERTLIELPTRASEVDG